MKERREEFEIDCNHLNKSIPDGELDTLVRDIKARDLFRLFFVEGESQFKSLDVFGIVKVFYNLREIKDLTIREVIAKYCKENE